MASARIYVGFSSSDVHAFNLMRSWDEELFLGLSLLNLKLSANAMGVEEQLKNECRSQLSGEDTFVVLIGKDTWYKHKCVSWQTEIAIEKGCRLIAVNLDNARLMCEHSCPQILANAGAIFVPFSPKIIAYAVKKFPKMPSKNYYYDDHIYNELDV